MPPQPLASEEKNLIVLWSPKSACTTTYVWFASVCGFVDEVRRYDEFPHRHRVDIFQPQQTSPPEDISGFKVVKIIRDPYSRAVSIYRHAQVTRFADDELGKNLAFERFLDAIQNYGDIKTLNPHCWPQVHPLEAERTPDVVINISKKDLFAGLNEFERDQNWPVTDFAAMDWLHRFEKSRRRSRISYDPLLTPSVKRKIETIYAADFEQYREFL